MRVAGGERRGDAGRNPRALRRTRVVALALGVAGALHGTACASPVVERDDGGYSHARQGWRVDAPGDPWTRAEVEGALLAFRAPGGAWMSLASRCGIAPAQPRVLVRHLAIGLRPRQLVAEREVRVDGRPGWWQTWRTRVGDAERELDALSVVGDGCVYDWVLVAPPGSTSLREGFERWWGTFRLAPPASPGSGAAP
jgi:hypothetical protein